MSIDFNTPPIVFDYNVTQPVDHNIRQPACMNQGQFGFFTPGSCKLSHTSSIYESFRERNALSAVH